MGQFVKDFFGDSGRGRDEPVLSVVLPVFNEEATLPELTHRLTRELERLDEAYEIIYINDGGVDQSLEIISQLVNTDLRIKV